MTSLESMMCVRSKAPTLRTELYTHASDRVIVRAPVHWGLGEIDGLLVPPGKASNLLTDHLITV